MGGCVALHQCLSLHFVCFLQRICILPAPILYTSSGEEKRRYLAYITKDKVHLSFTNMSVCLCLVSVLSLLGEAKLVCFMLEGNDGPRVGIPEDLIFFLIQVGLIVIKAFDYRYQ